MSGYLSDDPQLLRLYRNAGIVFSGNVVSSLLGLLVLAVLTRALTLEEFGLYALLTAYVGLLDRLTSFQTWQALIHYGARFREAGDTPRLVSLFALGWLLDVAGGVLGFILALVGALLVPDWFGLGENALLLTAIAAATLPVNWVATPTALMRLFDRFSIQALHQKTSATLTLTAVVGLWLTGAASLTPYLIAVTVCGIFNRLLFIYMGVREARKQGIWRVDLVDLREIFASTPRLRRFVITANADGVVRVLRDLDIFIVSALLGTAAVSVYKIARALAQAFGKLTGPFFQAIYPELARMAAGGNFNGFVRLMRQSSLTLGAIVGTAWLGFILLGPYLLPRAFSPDYTAAYPVAVACMAGMVVWAFAQPLSPAMMALGKVEVALAIHFGTSVAYVGILAAGISMMGLVGAGAGFFLFHTMWSLCTLLAVRHQLRRQEQSHIIESGPEGDKYRDSDDSSTVSVP